MYAPNYFAPTYFNAVWRAGAIGPKVVGLVVETIWGEEAANRFLALSRKPAETIQGSEEFHKLLVLARLIDAAIEAVEVRARYLSLRRRSDEAVQTGEVKARLRLLSRVSSHILDLQEAIDWTLARIGEAIVQAVSAEVWLSEAALRPLNQVRQALDALYIDELALIWPALGRRLVMVMSRAVSTAETKLRLRARVKRLAEALQLMEVTEYPGLIIRGLVHGGVKLRALISAALKVNKR